MSNLFTVPEGLTEYEFLRCLFVQVVKGWSPYPEKNLYIKHLTEEEVSEVSLIKQQKYLEAKASHLLPTYKEKLNEIIKDELWSEVQEKRVEELRIQIDDNTTFMEKMVVEEQKEGIKAFIRQLEDELSELSIKRQQIIGKTVEEFASKAANNYLIFLSFFKDSNLSIPYLTRDEYEDLYDNEFNDLYFGYQDIMNRFDYHALSRIAVMPFFLNAFSYVKDRPEAYFGKPLYKLSTPQTLLMAYGSRNINILTHAESEPPPLHTVKSVKEIVDWFDRQHSIQSSQNNSTNKGVTKEKRVVLNQRSV